MKTTRPVMVLLFALIVLLQSPAVFCNAEDAPTKILVIKGAIAAGSDRDLTTYLAAHLSNDTRTIDDMLAKGKLGMTEAEIVAFLIETVPHRGHTNCLVKRADTGKMFWTYRKCIRHVFGRLTGERIF